LYFGVVAWCVSVAASGLNRRRVVFLLFLLLVLLVLPLRVASALLPLLSHVTAATNATTLSSFLLDISHHQQEQEL
jgi:hypothetical protein